jgi:1L-myo-inositol 1-phosphate cytidylyltransferase / CDP-L-myo-inositol myo-inositolphosphotransferase
MQVELSHNELLTAPILVLVPAPGVDTSVPQNGADPEILGLRLSQRTVLAAHRAGYARIFFFANDGAALPDMIGIRSWDQLLAAVGSAPAARLVIVPSTVVSEAAWLRRLAAAPVDGTIWAAIAKHIVVVAPANLLDALVALQANGGARDMAGVEERLKARFGPAAGVRDADPLVVMKPQDLCRAEQRLLRGLVKDTDGFMARYFDRRISLQMTRLLAPTPVQPIQITILSLLIGLCGALLFLSPSRWVQTAGALLFLLHSIVDGCDGELARLKFQESRVGALLDFWGDNIVHVAVFGCIAIGWSASSHTILPLWFGAAAIIGTLGSAGFVHWHVLRAKDSKPAVLTSISGVSASRLARILDAASRRDFIYLLPIFAGFGVLNWILILAGIGAPVFLLLIVVLAQYERPQKRPPAA